MKLSNWFATASLVLGIASLPVTAARAQAADPAPPSGEAATELDQIMVTGEQPGPGLWKVSKGDHVLWILGTMAPLPKKMAWRAKDAEAAIAASQEVLAEPTAKVDVGFFRGLTLLPSLLHARKNPSGEKLEQVLPAELYARWLVLKTKYIGRDRGIEAQRPTLAARELYDKAIDRSGLTSKNVAWDVVKTAAKKNHVPIVDSQYVVEVDDPKAVIKQFENASVDAEIACLSTTIERIETDMQAMQLRANAWASGDLEALRKLPYPDQRAACRAVFESVPGLHDRIVSVEQHVIAQWVDKASAALVKNQSTFAVMSIRELLDPNGRLARLRALGYSVEEPQ